jgi:osmotically-inducible protein OsmY
VAAYYNNPLQYGLPNSTSTTGGTAATKTFGSPLFVSANTSNSSANVSRGNTNSGNSSSTTPAAGISVGPRYTQAIGWKMNNVPSARMQTQLQALIASSQGLSNPKGIQVSVDGQTIVLKGTAADEHERILAGAILGMSPGVGDIRNELKIQAPTESPPAGKQP